MANVCGNFRELYLAKKLMKNAKKKLNTLDDYKASIVYSLYMEANYTNTLPLNDGAVRSLEQLGIVSKAATQYPMTNFLNPTFPYMLQPWVVDELNQNALLREKYENSHNMCQCN